MQKYIFHSHGNTDQRLESGNFFTLENISIHQKPTNNISSKKKINYYFTVIIFFF